MNARWIRRPLALCFALSGAVLAQSRFQPPLPPDINSEQAGQELARRLRSSTPEESTLFEAVLKTRHRDGAIIKVPLTCDIRLTDDHWQVLYRTEAAGDLPAQVAVMLHRPDLPIQYRFAQATTERPDLAGDPRLLTPEEAARPLAGSDFWLTDLGLDFLYWPYQRLIKTEMRKSRWCHVLESRHPESPTHPYGRVVCWLDKEKGQPLLAEAYDRDDRLLKEFSIGSIRKVEGQWRVQDMKISNVQNRTRTWLEFDFD